MKIFLALILLFISSSTVIAQPYELSGFVTVNGQPINNAVVYANDGRFEDYSYSYQDGSYAIYVGGDAEYVVYPQVQGIKFTPGSYKGFVSQSFTNLNFEGTPTTYQISGKINVAKNIRVDCSSLVAQFRGTRYSDFAPAMVKGKISSSCTFKARVPHGVWGLRIESKKGQNVVNIGGEFGVYKDGKITVRLRKL